MAAITCDGKVAYPDHASAIKACKFVTRRKSFSSKGTVTKAYRCPVCGRWHVGRGPKA